MKKRWFFSVLSILPAWERKKIFRKKSCKMHPKKLWRIGSASLNRRRNERFFFYYYSTLREQALSSWMLMVLTIREKAPWHKWNFKNCWEQSLKRAQKIMKDPTNRTPTIIRSLKIWRCVCLWCHNSYEFHISCEVASDFNLYFPAIGWSNRCALCGFLRCFLALLNERVFRKFAFFPILFRI